MKCNLETISERRKEFIRLIKQPVSVTDLSLKMEITKEGVYKFKDALAKNGVIVIKERVKKNMYFHLEGNIQDALKKVRFEDYDYLTGREKKISLSAYTGAGWFGILARNEPIRI